MPHRTALAMLCWLCVRLSWSMDCLLICIAVLSWLERGCVVSEESFSNFALVAVSSHAIGHNLTVEFDQTVTTGSWLWKKSTTTKRTARRSPTEYWYYTDTGEYAPISKLDAMMRAWQAKHGLKTIKEISNDQ
jgi:hypothetical protein